MLIIGLLVLLEAQGSRAVTPVFVQKRNDVLLEVMKDDVPEEFLFFVWKFNKTSVVSLLQNSEPIVSEDYTERVEFSVENYSVKLKNLQETDNGVYAARVTDIEGEQIISEYKVTVQDPVSPVVLTVDSVSNSSTPCYVTVTCRTQDSHISSTFTCDTQTCSQEGGEGSKVTASGASHQVYLVNDYIICNHSNHVSWKNDTMDIKTYCGSKPDITNGVLASGAVAGVVVAGLVFVVIWLKCKRANEQKNQENTIYAELEDIVPAQNRIQTPVEDVSTVSPTTTYALVQFHTGPEKHRLRELQSPKPDLSPHPTPRTENP